MRLLIENANLCATGSLSFRRETSLVCENDRIVAVGETTVAAGRMVWSHPG